MNAIASSPVQSVIIPTYNRKEMLADAIDSVLNQRNVDLEVIVLDDCSTDGTEEFVKSLTDKRIRYFRNEKNIGVERGLCFALKQARGKYLSMIAQDDYYTDYDFFSKAINIFMEHENDSEPLAFVCANAEMLNMNTNQRTTSNIGHPGRVKGIDFILNPNHEYRKPLSTFPTVFKTEFLRKQNLETLPIFDITTYYHAAFMGDAWFMPDVIGVYRLHKDSLTLGYKHHPELEARHYELLREHIKRWKMMKEMLYDRTDRKTADKWYISGVVGLRGFYALSRPAIKDRLKVDGIILSVSGFMPKLWLRMMLSIPSTVKGILKSKLRKITPLRRLYKKIKYGDSHHGEH